MGLHYKSTPFTGTFAQTWASPHTPYRRDCPHDSSSECLDRSCFHADEKSYVPPYSTRYRDSLAESSPCRRSYCHETEQLLKSREDELKAAKDTTQSLRVQLFQYSKSGKKFEEAEKIYHSAIDDTASQILPTNIIELELSFADMQAKRGRYYEAEDIVERLLKRDKSPKSSISRECCRLLGSISCSLKDFNKAEIWYRDAYDGVSADESSLCVGDQLCEVMALKGDNESAQLKQKKGWDEKKKALGPRHPSTVKSGNLRVGYLKKMLPKSAKGGDETEDDKTRRLAVEYNIEDMLRTIWKSKVAPEQDAAILKVGEDLGKHLMDQQKYAEAKRVLSEVWQGRKLALGQTHRDTTISAMTLYEAIHRQGGAQKIAAAATILTSIQPTRTKNFTGNYAIAPKVKENLIGSYTGEDDKDAEEMWARSMEKVFSSKGAAFPLPEDAQFPLARSLFNQGGSKRQEAEKVLKQVWARRKLTHPEAEDTLICSRMLAEAMWENRGSIDEAMKIARRVFNARDRMTTKGLEFFKAGLLCSKLMLALRMTNEPEKILKYLWDRQPIDAAERQVRARCGDQYGKCLSRRGQYEQADRHFQAVRNEKKRLYPGPTANSERTATGVLKRDNEKLMEKKSFKTRSSWLF